MKLILFLIFLLSFNHVAADSTLIDKKVSCYDNTCDISYTIPNIYEEEKILLSDTINIDNIKNINIIFNNLSSKVYKLDDFRDNVLNKVYRSRYNEALMTLYSGQELSDYELSDELLDKKLKINGYSGVEELDLYYLDYFNKNYKENLLNINELFVKYFFKLWPDKKENSQVLESNLNIIQAYNNYYKEEDNSNLFPNTVTTYTLELNDLKQYSFNIEFSNNKEYGILKVHYLDTLGNYLTTINILNGLIGTKYEVKENTFNNYYLKEIKGNAVGEFSAEITDVYLIYDLIGEEKLVFNEDDNYVNTGIKKANFLPYHLIIIIILLIFWWKNEKKDY